MIIWFRLSLLILLLISSATDEFCFVSVLTVLKSKNNFRRPKDGWSIDVSRIGEKSFYKKAIFCTLHAVVFVAIIMPWMLFHIHSWDDSHQEKRTEKKNWTADAMKSEMLCNSRDSCNTKLHNFYWLHCSTSTMNHAIYFLMPCEQKSN